MVSRRDGAELRGRLLGRHLPERAIRYGAAALFAIFGIGLVIEAVIELS